MEFRYREETTVTTTHSVHVNLGMEIALVLLLHVLVLSLLLDGLLSGGLLGGWHVRLKWVERINKVSLPTGAVPTVSLGRQWSSFRKRLMVRVIAGTHD